LYSESVLFVGHREKIFTIHKFYRDSKKRKMAQCEMLILTQKSFIAFCFMFILCTLSLCVEKDKVAAATLKINHGRGTTVVCQCITIFLPEMKKATKESPYYWKPGFFNICHCSSLCQGFSLMNSWGSEEAKNNLCMSFPAFVIDGEVPAGIFGKCEDIVVLLIKVSSIVFDPWSSPASCKS
jgi:hypothetical protein